MLPQSKSSESSARIQADLQTTSAGRQVKIRLENYDEGLGWYTSGCVTIPLHQLPLLEQAIGEMRSQSAQPQEFAEIIPFPGLAPEALAE